MNKFRTGLTAGIVSLMLLLGTHVSAQNSVVDLEAGETAPKGSFSVMEIVDNGADTVSIAGGQLAEDFTERIEGEVHYNGWTNYEDLAAAQEGACQQAMERYSEASSDTWAEGYTVHLDGEIFTGQCGDGSSSGTVNTGGATTSSTSGSSGTNGDKDGDGGSYDPNGTISEADLDILTDVEIARYEWASGDLVENGDCYMVVSGPNEELHLESAGVWVFGDFVAVDKDEYLRKLKDAQDAVAADGRTGRCPLIPLEAVS